MRKVIVNFSGGKDSTVAILEAMKRYPKEEIILCWQDTGAEFRGTDEHIHGIADTLGLELVTLKPKRDWFEQVRHDNMPFTPALRKCTFRLKIDIFYSWLRKERENFGDEIIIVSGIRGEESLSRSKMQEWDIARGTNIQKGIYVYNWRPCLYMGVQEVFDRIKAEDLPLHYCYEFSHRCNCWLCIFAGKYELMTYAEMNPDEYEKACLLEDEIGKPLLSRYTAINDLFKQGRLL